jgi:hypothetical protein
MPQEEIGENMNREQVAKPALRNYMRWTLPLTWIFLAGLPLCADVCNPADLQGPYGFQLSGETTISGESKPVTNIGRMVLAGDGGISGYSTVMFAGYLLGNPITGTYEARWDCAVTWSLQDDSGAFQHFSGVATPGGGKVHFSQTDPVGAQKGVMARIPVACKTADLRKAYAFTMAGSTIPMLPGEASSTIAAKGSIQADENGNYKLAPEGGPPLTTDVAIEVDAECVVDIELTLPAADAPIATPMKLRGVLTDEGKQILAIQTDPGAMVSATFTALTRPDPVVSPGLAPPLQ